MYGDVEDLRVHGIEPEPAPFARHLTEGSQHSSDRRLVEVEDQSLCKNSSRARSNESGRFERVRPVSREIGAHHAPIAAGTSPEPLEHGFLVVEDVMAIQLEQHRALGPRQPERARVHSRGKKDDLSDGRVHDGRDEGVVEESRADREIGVRSGERRHGDGGANLPHHREPVFTRELARERIDEQWCRGLRFQRPAGRDPSGSRANRRHRHRPPSACSVGGCL